jgi:hypothetical protein
MKPTSNNLKAGQIIQMRRRAYFEGETKMNRLLTILMVVVLTFSASVTAEIIAESHFNSGDGGDGRDGWFGNYPGDGYVGAEPGDPGGYVIWDGSNGLPSGCLCNFDPGIFNTDGFVAPPKFLGDWRDNECIVFDFKKGTFAGAYPNWVEIFSGPTDCWIFGFTTYADLDWHEYTIPLYGSPWYHFSGSKSWEETLSNVTELFINGNVHVGDENNYLDNVILIGESAELPLVVEVDIKPGSCPNPLNVKDKGVLPVAVLGTEDFDVFNIDPASIRLEGVAPIRSSYEDVAAPVSNKSDDCDCTTEGPDGYLDLVLKFDVQEIVAALGGMYDGDIYLLTLTGETIDGTPIEGTDCVVIIAKK